LKSNPYTFLGDFPLHVAPGTGLDTPFTLLSFQTLSLASVLGVVTAALTGRGGPRLGKRKKIVYTTDITSLDVVGRSPFPYQLDGDYLGEVEALSLRYEPDLLSLVIPGA
jgi:diacylglycerol kinase family enzyme